MIKVNAHGTFLVPSTQQEELIRTSRGSLHLVGYRRVRLVDQPRFERFVKMNKVTIRYVTSYIASTHRLDDAQTLGPRHSLAANKNSCSVL